MTVYYLTQKKKTENCSATQAFITIKYKNVGPED